jgi:hypothetical protein
VSDRARQYLQQLGGDEFVHVNGSLAQHLAGTEALLRRWGGREALCLAGLYHAVYGTAGIRGSLASLAMRVTIAGVIGDEAEALAYLYGACERETFARRVDTTQRLRFADRFTGADQPITEAQLQDICEITVANEIELALASDAFLAKHRGALAELFARMQGWVSEAARNAGACLLR